MGHENAAPSRRRSQNSSSFAGEGSPNVDSARTWAVILVLAACLATHPTRGDAQAVCRPVAVGSAQVEAVRDGRTLVLDDGHELRLAAIEITSASREILAELVQKRALKLAPLGAARDRYGRIVAFAYAGDDPETLQYRLIANGAARVAAHVGDQACAAALLTAEARARGEGRGIWADPSFAPLAADDLARLQALVGRFVLVEGQILSVRRSGTTIYLNFGDRWARDFSVLIPSRGERNFIAAGLALATLKNRRVRVRGWLDLRAGPLIEVDSPEQVEMID